MSSGRGSPALHVATIAHDGRIWDVYLEFDADDLRPVTYRARVRFDPTDSDQTEAVSTTVIIIEDSHEEAVAKARAMDDRQLQALLRSCLPEPEL
jgi:hypothetical protein